MGVLTYITESSPTISIRLPNAMASFISQNVAQSYLPDKAAVPDHTFGLEFSNSDQR